MAQPLLDSLLASVDDRVDTGGASHEPVRRTAIEALRRHGLPDNRVEAWKYAPLRALTQRRFVDGDAAAGTHSIDTSRFALPGVEGPRVVFVNGVLRADLSCFPRDGELTVLPLNAIDEASLQTHHARLPVGSESAFAQLPAALAGDGIVVRVAAGARIDTPLHIIHATTTADADVAWTARVFVDIADAGSLTVVEHHVGDGDAHLGSIVCDVDAGRDACFALVQLQDGSKAGSLIRRTSLTLHDRALANVHALELGAQFARHDLAVDLAGAASRFVSRGVFAVSDRRHADTHLDVRHRGRDSACDIVWRGIADQRGRGVFHGGITIAAGADGSDAQLSSKNLLLSDQAEIDTQPVLVIHADDVKAAHGATVGQLDERALFYLRSRGIDEADARALLTMAFCRVATASIDNKPLADALDALLLSRLPIADVSA